MKELFGASMTTAEKREAQRNMAKEQADRASREMGERFGAGMTRGEMKVMKRGTRKGNR